MQEFVVVVVSHHVKYGHEAEYLAWSLQSSTPCGTRRLSSTRF